MASILEQDIDYYPYGGEQWDYATAPVPQNYKFTGKERDAESGLDNFGARYNASSLGRFMTPDWAAKPVTVPYAKFGDPQSLNLYAMVENGPLNRIDPDGHMAAAWVLDHNIPVGGSTFYLPADMENSNDIQIMEPVGEYERSGPASENTVVTAEGPAQNQKETVVFSDNANPQAYQEKPGVTADRTVDYQAAQMDKKGNIDSHDIERHADLTLHEKLDPNSKTKNVSIADTPTTSKGVLKDYQEVPAGGSYRVLRDWKVDGNSARVLDLNTHKAYGYELTTLDANSKTPIKTEYTNVPPF